MIVVFLDTFLTFIMLLSLAENNGRFYSQSIFKYAVNYVRNGTVDFISNERGLG